MDTRRNGLFAGIVIGVVGTLLLALLIMLATAYGGRVDVAASSGHGPFGRWFLETVMERSVRSGAAREQAPDLAHADLAVGGREYGEMCQHCHGGPGTPPAGWSRGMLPQPPELVEAAAHWSPAEIAWIVDHGIKSTGMPAFGRTHDAATVRDIAAFVAQLPAMTPADYARLAGGSGGHSSEKHHGGPMHDASRPDGGAAEPTASHEVEEDRADAR